MSKKLEIFFVNKGKDSLFVQENFFIAYKEFRTYGC